MTVPDAGGCSDLVVYENKKAIKTRSCRTCSPETSVMQFSALYQCCASLLFAVMVVRCFVTATNMVEWMDQSRIKF